MDSWLTRLTEPLYGIADVFLDSPVAAVITTSALGLAIAAVLLSFR